MFKRIKAINKALVLRCVSISFIIVGICLIGYTIKVIFIKPDYEIKSEYYDDMNSEGHILLQDDPNESSSEIADTKDKSNPIGTSYESLSEATDDKAKPKFVGISYEKGDYVGDLIIPSLDIELPIYEGTEKSELRKGVGRFIGSAQPGETDNCVLSGHRETVFSQLGDLELGETVIVKSELGLFSYEVDNIRIVDEDDRTVIVPYDEAILTLTTCYPFDGIGIAPERYIVSAKMTESKLAE